jgi:hypothetical protein
MMDEDCAIEKTFLLMKMNRIQNIMVDRVFLSLSLRTQLTVLKHIYSVTGCIPIVEECHRMRHQQISNFTIYLVAVGV